MLETLRLQTNPLGFPGYEPPERESVTVSIQKPSGSPWVVIEFDFTVMGGSLGIANGEMICRAFEHAVAADLPVLAVTRSGGARMQEGMLALAQMPATLQAREHYRRNCGRPFVSYLRNPTTGGVFASFASRADIILAEPGATIGFAGPRVALAFTGAELPEGSHTAENAHRHGLADALVAPDDLEQALAQVLEAWEHSPWDPRPVDPAPRHSPAYGPLGAHDAWDAVTSARHPARRARMAAICTPPFGDAIRWGPVSIAGRDSVAIQTSGGIPGPGDFRNARRAIAMAEALAIPLVVLVDTPGADPSASSEAAGIAREIAATMTSAVTAETPTLGLITGEGGSGGALALCAGADLLLIAEGAYFSVIAPEGAAAILHREDIEHVARDLRCGPRDLVSLGLADAVIPDADLSDQIASLLESPGDWSGASTQGGRGRWRGPGSLAHPSDAI